MKILVFTDIHADARAFEHIERLIRQESPDILIDCGDISIFENHLDELIERLASYRIQTLILHGNHETEVAMEKACKPHKNLIFMHDRILQIGNTVFFGWGGGGFAKRESAFTKAARKAVDIFNNIKARDRNLILLTHAPPRNTRLDGLFDSHVGNRSITEFIEKHQPRYAFCGHIHENSRKQDRIGKTIIINPGPAGRIIRI